LVLGADGFIGRNIVFHLRAHNVDLVAQARAPARLSAMGFQTLGLDLTAAACHSTVFWQTRRPKITHVINAAGLFTGKPAAFEAVHVETPEALYATLHKGHALLVSAVGIDANTPFALWRRQGQAVAKAAGATILQAGLVVANSSYLGSSVIRALASLPFATPVLGTGQQVFNPIHASDLAGVALACLANPPGPSVWEIGGPDCLSQIQLLQETRAWLGLKSQRVLKIRLRLAAGLGRLGDLLRLGPISATSVVQLEQGGTCQRL
jgi:uncharacterized protein YbjT (DUF2867 family)